VINISWHDLLYGKEGRLKLDPGVVTSAPNTLNTLIQKHVCVKSSEFAAELDEFAVPPVA
jgi:hypothetical protein